MMLPGIKIAFRQLCKNRLDTFIKFTSLLLSISGCLLITFFVLHELRYDAFYPNAERTFRVNSLGKASDGSEYKAAITPGLLGPFLESQISEIDQTVQVKPEKVIVKVANQQWEVEAFYASPNFLDFFSIPLQPGRNSDALVDPSQVVLTPGEAYKYFGSTDVVGKTLELRLENEFVPFKIGAVTEELPTYTTLPFHLLLPIYWFEKTRSPIWESASVVTFASIHQKTSISDLNQKVSTLVNEKENLINRKFGFQPLLDIHLGESYFGEIIPTTDRQYLYMATVAAIFLLIVGCINYISLMTGRAMTRAKEVGIKKVMGASRNRLIGQLFLESIAFVSFALILSSVMVISLWPQVEGLLQWHMTLYWWDPLIWMILLLVLMVTCLISGIYPAWFVTGFSATKILRGQLMVRHRRDVSRILMAIQFMVACMMLVGAWVMDLQLQFLRNQSLGYDESQVIRLKIPAKEGFALAPVFYQKIIGNTHVLNMSATFQGFGNELNGATFSRNIVEGENKEIISCSLAGGPSFAETLQVTILSGRPLDSDWQHVMPNQVLVNESLVRAMGWKDPLGKRISQIFAYNQAEIVGVVKDFHFQSLHQSIQPLVIHPADVYTNYYIRISGEDWIASIHELEKAWEEVTGGLPFVFHFLDDDLNRQYLLEKRWASIITITSIFITVLACIGLMGMIAMIISQRTKEVGIRKVLGAPVSSLMWLFSKDFSKMIMISCFLAIPFINYLIQSWLANFAYHVTIQWWMYGVPCIVILGLGWASIIGQIYHATNLNPIDSIRYE